MAQVSLYPPTRHEAYRPVRIAVASQDGEVVDQHFGHAEQFLVFELRSSEADSGVERFVYLETRASQPACVRHDHDDDRLARTVDLISDCAAVLVARIGLGAVRHLKARGILAYIVPDFIDSALQRLLESGTLPDSCKGKGGLST